MYFIPQKLEHALLSYLKRTYLPSGHANPKSVEQFNHHDLKFFVRGAAEMSAYFTSERKSMPKNYFNKKELRSGYLLYFVMTNFLKVGFCLNEAKAKDRFAGKNLIKIADIGCGPGTASLVCADYFKQPIEIVAIDQNTGSLHDAKHLFSKYSPNTKFKTVLADIKPGRNFLAGKFHILILSNFLSEFGGPEEQSKLVESFINKNLEDDGIIIIIEPALRWTSRNLMKLRDALLRPKHLRSYALTHLISPCLHNLPCPMLISNNRDWCHMYLDWERPKVIAEVDKLIGNRKDYLKFSYLILNRTLHLAPRPSNSETRYEGRDTRHVYRVVSAPMRSKGKIELLLCNETCRKGLLRITRPDKDASLCNQNFDQAKRGDLIQYKGSGRIEKNTEFKRISNDR